VSVNYHRTEYRGNIAGHKCRARAISRQVQTNKTTLTSHKSASIKFSGLWFGYMMYYVPCDRMSRMWLFEWFMISPAQGFRKKVSIKCNYSRQKKILIHFIVSRKLLLFSVRTSEMCLSRDMNLENDRKPIGAGERFAGVFQRWYAIEREIRGFRMMKTLKRDGGENSSRLRYALAVAR